jgi:hypothetical protein
MKRNFVFQGVLFMFTAYSLVNKRADKSPYHFLEFLTPPKNQKLPIFIIFNLGFILNLFLLKIYKSEQCLGLPAKTIRYPVVCIQ